MAEEAGESAAGARGTEIYGGMRASWKTRVCKLYF